MRARLVTLLDKALPCKHFFQKNVLDHFCRCFLLAGRLDASAHIAGSEERGHGGRAALSEPASAGEFAALPYPSDERTVRA